MKLFILSLIIIVTFYSGFMYGRTYEMSNLAYRFEKANAVMEDLDRIIKERGYGQFDR